MNFATRLILERQPVDTREGFTANQTSTGKTTREIDAAIQVLMNTGSVTLTSDNPLQTEKLLFLVKRRLQWEHTAMLYQCVILRSGGVKIELLENPSPSKTYGGILSAAVQIAKQNGVHSLTGDTVAKAANVSRTLIFHHFGTMADLKIAVEDVLCSEKP